MPVLRNFEQMWSAYPFPGGPAEDVKRMIGGQIDSPRITNTCVIRVSRAFNYSGNPIPRDPHDDFLTLLGADERAYGLRVAEFFAFMRRRYGSPTLSHAYDPPGGPIPDSFRGRCGVILFEVDGWVDATGHADLWDGERCRHQDYFHRAHHVHLWEVRDLDDVPSLGGSVGKDGRNRAEDVSVVQGLLAERGEDPGPVDGVVGPRTIAAIRRFQRRFLAAPDGRVDVNGRTWRELLGQ